MRRKGPWSPAEIEAFLRDARIPLRLACNGASGHPVLASLWYVPIGGKLWCATQRGASVVSLLQRDPRCSFEVSVETLPYSGVRGPAVVTLDHERGEEILRTLIDRYPPGPNSKLARLLLARVDQEVAIAIEPQRFVSWDFRHRMGDAA
jgi:nitroimidazol reductase NimA-like FMN-containing flavoprotein (pyridoxamine 5'-phosphate oxidase superfamily)